MKRSRILLIAILGVFILGLILYIKNDTPYHVCSMWISSYENADRYLYACNNITGYAIGYFGGIISMALSIFGFVLFIIRGRIVKKSTKVVKSTNISID